MLFTLEALPAAEGDCLLVHWGTAAAPKLAVVDGGPGQIYEKHLLPRLEQIAASRKVKQLSLELVMVSHVDTDHVAGVRKLFRDLRTEIEDAIPAGKRLLSVNRLWHNTFNDILGDGIDKYYKTMTASLAATSNGAPNPEVASRLEEGLATRFHLQRDAAAVEATAISLILAGHSDGRKLRIDHKFLFDKQQTAPLNAPIKDANGKPTLVTAQATGPIKIAGLEFRIVGPLGEEIEDLQENFDKYVKANGLTVEAVLAAYSDPSVTNLSSIVCLVSSAAGSILLTGDARGDRVLAGLRHAGLLTNDPLEIDVLKVPHHGSDRNVEQEFFERVVAKHYVFSGNGKHGNPERETLAMLAAARGKSAEYHVHFTYPVEETDAGRKADAEQKGKAWSKKKHSLASLFDSLSDYSFTLHDDEPIKIELGDETIAW